MKAFRIHSADTVATMLADTAEGEVEVFGGDGRAFVRATEPVQLGHKIATAGMAPGDAVVKYGVTIGLASREIRPRNGSTCITARAVWTRVPAHSIFIPGSRAM